MAPVRIEGLARAVQMVAAGLERDELKSTILRRLLDTGAVSTEEQLDRVWELGQAAASAGYLLSAGDTAGFEEARSKLLEMGSGNIVITAKVQVLPPPGQEGQGQWAPIEGEETEVWRTIQVTSFSGASPEDIMTAIQAGLDELEDERYSALFGAEAQYGAPVIWSILRGD